MFVWDVLRLAVACPWIDCRISLNKSFALNECINSASASEVKVPIYDATYNIIIDSSVVAIKYPLGLCHSNGNHAGIGKTKASPPKSVV